MPRHDDRYGGTRLYVGRLSSRTRSRDLEDLFSRYGRIRDVDLKHNFAFIEFNDPRDADDARYALDGRDIDGSRILVEFAKGGPRGAGASREYLGRGPPPGSGRCFNCGLDGHWARDCKAGDWKNRCYRCGDGGHIERNCQNSPKSLKGRSYSRSPSPRRGRSRSRSRSLSRSRSYSRSRSPAPRRDYSVERDRRSRSPRGSRSPPPSKGRRRSLSPPAAGALWGGQAPNKGDEHEPTHKGHEQEPPTRRERSRSPPRRDISRSPPTRREMSRSPPPGGRTPVSNERGEDSPSEHQLGSPQANGRSPSPGGGEEESPRN
ncbi:unnamed protein product [Spirodela intermedia]|uniref:Uncharacterized protein n=1 Tax=Spirodela intermedia TaxID=51605 RepID=A0A7I8IB90_SPIIN|nr:unnamed protein product [Spirodela intermedia]CAA6654850.1 unnamed protein product [Spirodela intermedia]